MRMSGCADYFEGVLSALDDVDGTLGDAVEQSPQQVQAVFDQMVELRRAINTEVVSLLGVAVGFSDTDGDSQR